MVFLTSAVNCEIALPIELNFCLSRLFYSEGSRHGFLKCHPQKDI